MEALCQIVGCIYSSKPAAERIDDFAAQLRRERAVVLSKDAQAATFVRFNAADARLVALACQFVLSQLPSSLRFGFAAGTGEVAGQGKDGAGISQHSLAQAQDLAAAARDGEVLVAPQLAVLLIESGLSLHSRQVHLPGGRVVSACSLDLIAGAAQSAHPAGRPLAEGRLTDALGSVYRTLMSQADEMARRQGELEARLDATAGRAAPATGGSSLATYQAELEAELDAQMTRVEGRLRFIDTLERRVDKLSAATAASERKLAELPARRGEIEALKALCDRLGARLLESQHRLDGIAAAQQQLIPLAAQLAALVQSLESSQQAVAAYEGRLNALDSGADAVEHRIRALAEREAQLQSRAHTTTHLLGDIKLNLEMLGEQRSVIDHVGEKVARLDFTLQEAQNTLRALQREREVAERIEQGIKALRSRNGAHKLTPGEGQ